jgi:PHD/YefM family antitoxin component YafN of YafNO toxin-antitoxin module
MLDESSFPVLDVSKAQRDLAKLYRQVADEKRRVELMGSDGSCGCVLISKEELQSLEHAIELLADTEQVREMTAQFSAVIDSSEMATAGA